MNHNKHTVKLDAIFYTYCRSVSSFPIYELTTTNMGLHGVFLQCIRKKTQITMTCQTAVNAKLLNLDLYWFFLFRLFEIDHCD